MTKTLLLVGALLVAPLALAHYPPGMPKTFCEPPRDWAEHDYNLDPPPSPLWPSLPGPDEPQKFKFPALDGAINDCNGDTVPDEKAAVEDYDGHHDFGVLAFAVLSVATGDGMTSGTLACWDEQGHHPAFGPIVAKDVLQDTMAFTVYADAVNLLGPDPLTGRDCGDFLHDVSTPCIDACVVTFPPGLDGAYLVQVGDVVAGYPATHGHVCSPACLGPTQPACMDGDDNDLDGAADWPADNGCIGPTDPDERPGSLGTSSAIERVEAILADGP